MVPRSRRRLPDLCVIALLQQMPLNDQLLAGNMNSRWTVLLRAANRRVRSLTIICEKFVQNLKYCQYQLNSLVLGGSSRSMQMLTSNDEKPQHPTVRLTKWNCLRLLYDDAFNVNQFVDAFSAITELKFFTSWPASFKYLVEMLEKHPHWSRQLTSFTLMDYYFGVKSGALSAKLNNRLFAVINTGMPALQRFAISWRMGLKMVDDLPVIAQLKVLSAECFLNAFFNVFLRSLDRYSEDAVELQVILNCDIDFTFLSEMEHFSEETRNRVVGLGNRYRNWTADYSDLHRIFNAFRSLVSFSLDSHMQFFARHFATFSQSTQLVHLNLYVSLHSNESISPTAVINSVRALDLNLNISDHKNSSLVNWLNLGHTLPNLEVIYLRRLQCYRCFVILSEFTYNEDIATGLPCLRAILQQLHSTTGLPLSRILLDIPNYRTAEEVCNTTEEV